MKLEKAIEILKEQKLFTPLGQACHTVIPAAERQIPKGVTWTPAYQSYYSAGDEAEPLCPTCGTLLEDDQKICIECGQKLEWFWEGDERGDSEVEYGL